MHKIKTLSVMGVWLSLLWLTACSPSAPTSTPTIDLNPLRTEVAATVLAQVTRALALTPSAPPLASPSTTPPATSTAVPSASPAPSVTASPSTGTPTGVTVNLAQWVAQTISDNTVFTPGQSFTMTWTLKNSGTSTWTAGYLLRYYSGDTLGATKEVAIGQEVQPGGQIDISLQMKAPVTPGSYRSDWVMSTESRSNFKEPVYLKIRVATPVTPTVTPKP